MGKNATHELKILARNRFQEIQQLKEQLAMAKDNAAKSLNAIYFACDILREHNLASDAATIMAFCAGDRRRMFTKQHYDALAALLKAQRARIETEPRLDERDQQHHALSEFQHALIKHLRQDNPKFKELLFIAASGHVENH